MAVIYRVNMSDLSVRSEEASKSYAELGGRGLTSAIVGAEVPATCHPLSAENKLVLAPGILSGTGAPCSGRISAGAKSPLTGTIKESNAGGMAAQTLGRLGIGAIVVEGIPGDSQARYVLRIDANGAEIAAAPDGAFPSHLTRRCPYP